MNLTDNEIIKALEYCAEPKQEGCSHCLIADKCISGEINICACVLDLINRQKVAIDICKQEYNDMFDIAKKQKAEIESLKDFQKDGFFNLLGNCLVYSKNLKDYNDMRKGLKAEGIKEFAKRVQKIITIKGRQKDYFDNLVKEMVGE